MAAGLPTSRKVEVEFGLLGGGSWTDISADVEWQAGLGITSRGRTSPYGTTQAASLTFTLNNITGKYSPQRQILADGVTAAPYYPNVVPRKRIRYSYVTGGTTYVRFLGFIQSWTPAMVGNVLGRVTVVAVDRYSALSKITLKSPIAQATLQSLYRSFSASYQGSLWPLTEPAGSLSGVDLTATLPPLTVTQAGTGGTLVFGDNGPGVGDGTGVKLTPASATAGLYLAAPLTAAQYGAFEVWVNLPSPPATTRNVIGFDNVTAPANSGPLQLGITSSGFPTFTRVGDVTITGTASVCDGGWHLITVASSGLTNLSWAIYVDGVSVASATGTASADTYGLLTVGNGAPSQGAALFSGNLGYVSIYSPSIGQSAGSIAPRAAARNGFASESVNARVQRLLGYGGLGSSDWNLDTGVSVLNTYPQAGKKITDACYDATVSEGGGSVFYIAPDGRARFADRHFRKGGSPAITLDAVNDLDGSVFAGSLDDLSLVNTSIGNRATDSGTQTTQTFANGTSVNAYGTADDGGFDSYAMTDADVLGLAQWRVAIGDTPDYRLKQVSVDLATAQSNLYASLASVEIGSRLRTTSVPASVSPTSQLDVIVEGWTEDTDDQTYRVTFDTSPADNPAFGLYGPSTYGLFQADSGTTLNASITLSATTLAIATTGTTFTTTAGSYPFNIQIGQEVITLNSAPSGSTSPQTFTGVTRGANGTPAAAQASGAAVSVWPLATYGF